MYIVVHRDSTEYGVEAYLEQKIMLHLFSYHAANSG